MSIERLQAAIREKKTPVALGLAPEIDKVPAKILKNFEDMFGPGMMANAEALRFHGCQAMDAAQGKLPAVVISAEHYLRYGMMGADVLSNLTGAASARGLYAIVDCRTTRPELWLTSPMVGDGFTVMPYVGGDCVPESTDTGIFAVVRTANERSGEVQNLIDKTVNAPNGKLYLSDTEFQRAAQSLNGMRNAYLSAGRSSGGIDRVLAKLMNSKYRHAPSR